MRASSVSLMVAAVMLLAALPLIVGDSFGEKTRMPPILQGVIDTYFETSASSYILGNVTIETEGTLVVTSGTTLYTDSSSIITVKGTLELRGEEDGIISFVPSNEEVFWRGIGVLEGGKITGTHFSIVNTETAISFSGAAITLDYGYIANSSAGLVVHTTPVEESSIMRLTFANITQDAVLLDGVDSLEVGYIKARGEVSSAIHLRTCNNVTLHDLDIVISGAAGIYLEGDNSQITISRFLLEKSDAGVLESGIALYGNLNMVDISYGLIAEAGKAIYSLGPAICHNLTLSNLQIFSVSGALQLVADGKISLTNVSLMSSEEDAIAIEDASGPEGLVVDLYHIDFDFFGVQVSGDNATLILQDDVNITVIDEPLSTPLEGAHLTVTAEKRKVLFNDTLPVGWTLLKMPVYIWDASGGRAPKYSFTATAGEEPYTATEELTAEVFDEQIPGTMNVTLYLNLPPVFSGEDSVAFAEDTYSLLNLSALFSDPEGENLSFEASSNTENILVDLNGTLLNISARENYYGNGTVEVTATDLSGASTKVTLSVNVTAVNDAPFINAPGDWNVTVRAGENYTLNLSSIIGDVETPIKNLTVRVMNCTYATVNGTSVTFLFPSNTTLHTVYPVIVVSDGELETSAVLRVVIEGGGVPPGPGPTPKVNITSAEVKIQDGNWVVDVEATPNSTIYIVIEGVGSFKLTEKSPGVYHAEISEDRFEEGRKYSYYFSTSEGGENIAPAFSGELKQPKEREGVGTAAMIIIVVVVLLVLALLVYIFTRKKGEGIEEE